MGVRFVRCLAVMALMALMPSLAHAQSSITGTIRDASGAVLPGVTVEAASPVLIEKVRSTVSDGTGRYRLTELLPGTYSADLHAARIRHREARRCRDHRRRRHHDQPGPEGR